MTANMTTATEGAAHHHGYDGYNGCPMEDWESLVLVSTCSRPNGRSASAPVSRMTAAEIERADYEAARELGVQRRKETVRQEAKVGSTSNLGSGWLKEEPRQWRGRKIRSRSNKAVYCIRQVFNSGRVEMEKTFMLYNSNVDTIRKDFDPA